MQPDFLRATAAAIGTAWRPGLAPARYATITDEAGLIGAAAGLGADPTGLVTRVSGRGDVIRLTAPDAILAERGVFALPPGGVIEVIAILRRAVNTTDPNGDTLRLGIRWLAADFSAVGSIASGVLDDVVLTAAMGAWRSTALIAAESGLGADLIAPAGAVYGRLYVRAFGVGGATDIETLGHHEATRLAALAQRIAILES